MSEADALLARIDERTEFIQDHIKTIETRCDHHSERIGILESWRNKALGALGVIGIILGIYGYMLIF